MATFSYNFTETDIENLSMQPDHIATGTAAPTTGKAVEVRIDLTKIANTKMVILALESLIRRLEDGRYGPLDLGAI